MGHELDCRWIGVDVGDKEMSAYVCAPRTGEPRPAVIVLQEIFGVTRHIRAVTERIAHEGYVAVAPDLYHRQGERLESDYTSLSIGIERMQKLREQEFLRDMDGLLRWLRGRPAEVEDRVGVIGFCMGGRLAFLTACTKDVHAAVSFYGVGVAETQLERAAHLRCPILMVFGSEDHMIPPAAIESIRAALAAQSQPFDLAVYEGASHGFFCDERESYRPEAAAAAWGRLTDWFARYLKVA